jgi:hypothetical protein
LVVSYVVSNRYSKKSPISQRCRSRGSSAGDAHGQRRARVPYLVGSRLPTYYNFRAGIQSFQDVARHFPGDLRRASQTTLAFSGPSAGVAHGQLRARVPYLVGPRLPTYYNLRAWIQSFQDVARHFPGDSRCAFQTTLSSSGPSAGVSHGAPRVRVPHLVGRRLPTCYNFRAGIQSFQGVAAQFPSDSLCRQPLAPRGSKQLCRSRGWSAGGVHGLPRAPVPHLVGSRLPRPYHFKSLQSHLPADSLVAVRPSLAAIPATETPRCKKSTIGPGDLREQI